jgi:hypothetical protein
MNPILGKTPPYSAKIFLKIREFISTLIALQNPMLEDGT